MKFLNRTPELARLRAGLAQAEASLMVLYGRRRCGKSTLLQKIVSARDVYCLATQEDAVLQRAALAKEIARVVPRFDAVAYPSWAALIETLNERVSSPVKVLIDEFPYWVQTAPELPSVIQRYWDGPGPKRVSLLLCGSSQRMMQGLVLDQSAPLYGRASEIIRLSPLSPGWIGEALKMKPRDAVEAYAVWGGVPRYWELASAHASTRTALAQLVLDRHGVLFDEPLRLLLDDMRGPVQAISLLTLIGYGCHRLSEIAGRLGKPAGSLVRPLGQLIDLGYVRRELPFGESTRTTKRSLYKLADPFLRFYFRFVEPHRSRIEMGLGTQIAAEISAQLPGHVAHIWEDLARESVPFLEPGEKQWSPATRWWGADHEGRPLELDVVAESIDGSSLLVGEAKWGATGNNPEHLHAQLMQKAIRCPAVRGKKIVTALWLGNNSKAKRAHNQFTEAQTLNALKR